MTPAGFRPVPETIAVTPEILSRIHAAPWLLRGAARAMGWLAIPWVLASLAGCGSGSGASSPAAPGSINSARRSHGGGAAEPWRLDRLAGACGAVRLRIEAEAGGDGEEASPSVPESREVLSFDFEDGVQGWRPGTPAVELTAAGGSLHGRIREARIRQAQREGGRGTGDGPAKIVMGVRVDLDASRVHAMHLGLSAIGSCEIAWAWNAQPRPPDDLAGHTAPVPLPRSPAGAAGTSTVVLEDREGWKGRIRWCGLVLEGPGKDALAVDFLRLVEVPFARRLAARLEGGEEGVGPLGGERRRARELVEGHPLRVVLPEGHGAGRVRMAFASPSVAGHARERFTAIIVAHTSKAIMEGGGGAGGAPGTDRQAARIVIDPGRGGGDEGWRELEVDVRPGERWLGIDLHETGRRPDAGIGLIQDQAWWVPSAAASPAPILFLITVDTLRADALSVYGQAAIRTEAFERLAREGACFQQAYTAVNATTPSHATIFTSLYPKDHGVYDNRSSLASGALTLAEILHDHGWSTAAVTSVPHLNPDASGLGQGFDVFDSCPPGTLRRGEDSAALARKLLVDGEGVPRFLWLHLFDPHTPYEPPRDCLDRVPPQPVPPERIAASLKRYGPPPLYREIPRYGAEGAVMLYVRRYLGEVLRVDHILGALLDTIDELGARDRTLLIVVADHGESLWEHGVWFGHGGLYEPVVRVPLLVRGPGIAAGIRPAGRVDTLGILPAFLDAAGIAPESAGAPFRGRSLLARGNRDEEPDPVIFFEHANREGAGFLLGTRKAFRIDFPPEAREDPNMPPLPPRGLYDLAGDPDEAENLGASHPAEMEASLRRIQAWRADRVGLNSLPATLTPEEEQQLEQLGYR